MSTVDETVSLLDVAEALALERLAEVKKSAKFKKAGKICMPPRMCEGRRRGNK